MSQGQEALAKLSPAARAEYDRQLADIQRTSFRKQS